jgi:hypothetical protein
MNIQETDRVVEEAIEEMARKIREKAAEFWATHAERKLTISVIERLSDRGNRGNGTEQGEAGTADTDHPGGSDAQAERIAGTTGRDRGDNTPG